MQAKPDIVSRRATLFNGAQAVSRRRPPCSPNRYGNVFRTSAGAWAGGVLLFKVAGETLVSKERHYA